MSDPLIDDAWSSVGPGLDGTWTVPEAAQQTNDPSNTAGFPSITSQSALDVLKYGVATITDTWKFSQMLDYKRFEATNGGTFAQGRPATIAASSNGKAGSQFMLAGLLLVAFLIYTHKA
jgi:hypothetical protein